MFQDGEMLDGMVLDGCGTVALDEALELLRGMVVKQVSDRGLQTGHNLCPGGYQIPWKLRRSYLLCWMGRAGHIFRGNDANVSDKISYSCYSGWRKAYQAKLVLRDYL